MVMDKFLRNIIFAAAAAVYLLFCIFLPLKFPFIFRDFAGTVDITITPGMTAAGIASAMKEAGLVQCPAILLKQMRLFGIDKKLQPGAYTLNKGLGIAAARQLLTTKPHDVQFMLVPGTRYEELAGAFNKSGGPGSFDREMSDDSNFPESMRLLLPPRAEDRIAFLLPETYFLAPAKDQSAQFIRRASALWLERITNSGAVIENIDKHKLFKLAVIASIVESEARKAEERPILAGIFIKRLAKFMPLQSCATVMYCWKERGVDKRKLTYKDLQIDSPYNTYKYQGLPPGPICAPSESSWKSVFAPIYTDYLFFFAADNGSHIFSRTYQEHIKKQKTIK